MAVEHAGPFRPVRAPLHHGGVRELGAVVREEDGEEPSEKRCAEPCLQPVEDVHDRPRRVRVPYERQHEAAAVEVDGQQDLGAPLRAEDAVDLHDVGPSPRRDEGLEVLARPSGRALPVDPPFPRLLPLLQLCCPRLPAGRHAEMVPPDHEHARVDQPVERLLRDGHLVRVGKQDMMEGLPQGRPPGDDLVDPGQLLLREVEAVAAGDEDPPVVPVRRIRQVMPFLEGAPRRAPARVADIGGLSSRGHPSGPAPTFTRFRLSSLHTLVRCFPRILEISPTSCPPFRHWASTWRSS